MVGSDFTRKTAVKFGKYLLEVEPALDFCDENNTEIGTQSLKFQKQDTHEKPLVTLADVN